MRFWAAIASFALAAPAWGGPRVAPRAVSVSRPVPAILPLQMPSLGVSGLSAPGLGKTALADSPIPILPSAPSALQAPVAAMEAAAPSHVPVSGAAPQAPTNTPAPSQAKSPHDAPPAGAAARRAAGNAPVLAVPGDSRESLARERPALALRFAEFDAAFPINAADAATLSPGALTAHAGLRFTKGGVEIAVTDRERTETAFIPARRRAAAAAAEAHLADYAARTGKKIVSAGLAATPKPNTFSSRLWLRDDIVPVYLGKTDSAGEAARAAAGRFVLEDGVEVPIVRRLESGEVEVPDLVSREAYRAAVDPGDWDALAAEARRFGRRIAFFSSTPRGGGVALMRHALLRLLRLVGVDARWFVLDPDAEVFSVTKRKFHNQLQGVAPPGNELEVRDISLLENWWAANAVKFERVFRESDVIVIDDYQPSGLIPAIKRANPKARILYRSHIQIQGALVDAPGTPQNRVWEFLWKNIGLADAFISHPLRAFVPAIVPEALRVYLPATTDPIDGLNKKLSEAQIDYYLDAFNRRLEALGQSPLDRGRAYAAQIARFDPSKGIDTVLEGYARFRERLRREGVPESEHPQLVFAGHGAIDDVQGSEVFAQTLETIRSRYPELADDIKAAPLPAVDQFLNAIRRRSAWLEQLSIAEGFEINVTEASMKGKAIIGSGAGGIPLQIDNENSGLVVPPGDAAATALAMHRIWTDGALRARLEAGARARRPRVHTIHSALRWLTLGRGAMPADAGIKPLW